MDTEYGKIYVVLVDTALDTFQTPSMSLFLGGIGNTALRFVAGVIGSELFSRLKAKLSVSSQLRVEALIYVYGQWSLSPVRLMQLPHHLACCPTSQERR
jgi:hypothetical protein